MSESYTLPPIPVGGGRIPYPYYAHSEDDYTYPSIQNSLSISKQTMIPGYDRDGDMILLPSANGNNLVYYNAAGTLQWSKTKASLVGAADEWVGFFFLNDLLYICTVDLGVPPNRYYFTTISKNATLNQLGSNASNIWNGTVSYNRWNLNTDQNGSMQIQYDPTSGDMYMWQNFNAANQTIIVRVSITTGLLTTSSGSITNDGGLSSFPLYFTPKGVIVLASNTADFRLSSHEAITGASSTGRSNLMDGPTRDECSIEMSPSADKLVSYIQEDEGIALLIPVRTTLTTDRLGKKFYDKTRFDKVMDDSWQHQGFQL